MNERFVEIPRPVDACTLILTRMHRKHAHTDLHSVNRYAMAVIFFFFNRGGGRHPYSTNSYSIGNVAVVIIFLSSS